MVMKYKVYVSNGYIISIAYNVPDANITEEDYQQIQQAINNKPIAPDGYDYKLKENLEWELFQLPEPEEDLEE